MSLTLKPRSNQAVCYSNWTYHAHTHAKVKLITNPNLASKNFEKFHRKIILASEEVVTGDRSFSR